jgi:peptidyl-prolyl cis-trans isomerase B (cyclophilin B)
MSTATNNPVIRLELPGGMVLIECLPEIAHNHVAQILNICDNGWYDGVPFHRVIEGFMAQGGWTQKNPPALQAEFNGYPHVAGTCSMARTNDPHSASDQFFICFADCSFLNGQYTAWGRVIYGMDVVNGITRGEPPAEPTCIVSMRRANMQNI